MNKQPFTQHHLKKSKNKKTDQIFQNCSSLIKTDFKIIENINVSLTMKAEKELQKRENDLLEKS